MSDATREVRGEQIDVQSVQSSSVQHTSGGVGTNQQRSASQAERSDKSSHGERSGRGDRQRIQRSSSSTSSSSSSSIRGARGPARVEAQTVVTTHQQYDNAYPQGTTTNGAYVASVGSLGSVVSGERRQGRHRRQVIRLPDQPQGQVRQVRRRLPTPEPDTLERVFIQRTAGEVVEEITEIPTTPPPRIQERTVVEPAGPPQVIKRVIRVPPRGGSYGNYQQQQQQQQQQQGGNFQSVGGALGTGSYGNIQQAASAYQQPANTGSYQQFSAAGPAASSGAGYSSGYASSGASYGSVGGGYQVPQPQQQGYAYGGNAGGYSSQQVSPPIGCHPAFCFYV